MSQKTYYGVSGTIFLVVAIVHLLRVVNGWEININDWNAPMWGSWAGVVVAGWMAYHGLKRR